LPLNKSINIFSERLLIKSLTIEDVTENYLSWITNKKSNLHIEYSSENKTLNDLKFYVESKIVKIDTIFLGIFDKNKLNHIGNIKYEPVNLQLGEATMGIMIGDESYRGIGIAKEVILSTSTWLQNNLNIINIKLKVANTNNIAIKVYESIGFHKIRSLNKFQNKSDTVMVKKLNE
jgi:[ribosomal protein S5]-alanine N-acetyltransferase